MRSPLVLLVLTALLFASPALATGVDIGWDNCMGDPGATSLKTFACNTNSGTESLWVSFESPVAASAIGLLEVAIEFRTRSGAPLPAWWDFEGLASCRPNQLYVDVVPPSSTPTCAQLYTSATPPTFTVDRIDYQFPTTDVGRLIVAARPTGSIVANKRYFACRLLLSHAKTIGCTGCDMPASLNVTVHVDGVILTDPIHSNTAFWQTLPVATRTTSWSALKQ